MFDRDTQLPKIWLAVPLMILLGALALVWVLAMMNSLFNYRSPLADRPPEPGPAWSEALTRRVVFVLIDGLREDTSRDTEIMPVLNRLRQQGASAVMHSRPPSYSAPGYSVLLTGAWPELSTGPAMNLPYDDYTSLSQETLFGAAHSVGLNTALSGFNWFEKLVPQGVVDQSFYTPGEDQTADRDVVDAALPWLEQGEAALLLVHLDQVDYAGHHEGGPRDRRWAAAASRVDSLLGEIALRLDLSRDTLFIASDHGHIDRGGHGGYEAVTLVEPFVLAGAGVIPGDYGDVQMVDVAPTLAALLGAGLPAGSQGRVLQEMLDLSPEAVDALPAATLAQQSRLLAAYRHGIGASDSATPDPKEKTAPAIVAAFQDTLQQDRLTRLRRERLPRALLALLVTLLPAAVIWRRRTPLIRWLGGGALLYLLLYHLAYTRLEGRTYSLSSVSGVNSVISSVAVTAAGAFLLAWLLTSWFSGGFGSGARQAAAKTLTLTLGVLYLLTLLLVWGYALNGAVTTWALPDYRSQFLAFLALLQIPAVGLSGLLLAAFSAWLGRSRERA